MAGISAKVIESSACLMKLADSAEHMYDVQSLKDYQHCPQIKAKIHSSYHAGNSSDIRSRQQQREDTAGIHHLFRHPSADPLAASQPALTPLCQLHRDFLHCGLHPHCHRP